MIALVDGQIAIAACEAAQDLYGERMAVIGENPAPSMEDAQEYNRLKRDIGRFRRLRRSLERQVRAKLNRGF